LLDLDFRLAIVTFNYELIIPKVLGPIGDRMVCAVELPNPPFDELSKGTVPWLQAHGGINQFLVEPSDCARRQPNPWLAEPFHMHSNASTGSETRFYEPGIPPFVYFPLAPTIVPPGHQGNDICNPHSRVSEMSRTLLAAANAAIFCGLSGAPPDKEEFEGLVNSIRPGALTVQVGLTGDEGNDLANLLRASPAGYSAFLHARELVRMPTLLEGRFALTRDKWARWCA
jgi:hypothetical protein